MAENLRPLNCLFVLGKRNQQDLAIFLDCSQYLVPMKKALGTRLAFHIDAKLLNFTEKLKTASGK